MKTAKEPRLGPVLEILSGDLAGRSYAVDEAEFLIGRAPTCHIVIPKRYISREHARIVRQGRDRYVVDGLSHTNPVVMAGRPVRDHVLTDGDVFELCGIAFRFRVEGRGAGRKQAGIKMSGSQGSQLGVASGGWRDDDDAPAGISGDDWRDDPGPGASDGWSHPADDGWADDEPSTDAVAVRPMPRSTPRGSVRASQNPDQVVFDVDEPGLDASGDPEATGELDVKASAAADQGSSVNEQTAELGVAASPDDPNYDPFAEVDRAGPKKQKTDDPAREKLMRTMIGVAMVGIALAGGILWKVMEQPPIQPIDFPTPIVVRPEEVVRFDEPWSSDDPPLGVTTRNPVNGQPYVWLKNDNVWIEWALPAKSAKTIFLIQGREEGDAYFKLEFPESRRRIRYHVIIEGEPPHKSFRELRRKSLEGLSPYDLKGRVDSHRKSAELILQEKDVPGKEGSYRLALIELQAATDAAATAYDVMAKRGGTVPQEVTNLLRECEDREKEVRNDYEVFVSREEARYKGAVRTEGRKEQVKQLQRLLRAINHECDLRFQRYKLLLEEHFAVPWRDDAGRCEAR